MRASVRLHFVFLRKGCILPNRIDLIQEPVEDRWARLENLSAPAFDATIRQAGWRFMWIRGSCIRIGFGITSESAAIRALTHALNGIARQFNAAEFDSVHIAGYLGFHVAAVTPDSERDFPGLFRRDSDAEIGVSAMSLSPA
jgi:hypothetical protein